MSKHWMPDEIWKWQTEGIQATGRRVRRKVEKRTNLGIDLFTLVLDIVSGEYGMISRKYIYIWYMKHIFHTSVFLKSKWIAQAKVSYSYNSQWACFLAYIVSQIEWKWNKMWIVN